MMGSVEKTGSLVTTGAPTNLLEEMKLLKEMQDQSGLWPSRNLCFFLSLFLFFLFSGFRKAWLFLIC